MSFIKQKEDQRVVIRSYEESDFDRLALIHDQARLNELALADLSEAFVPFKIAAKEEGLFDYEVVVAELNDEVVGFVAFASSEIAWLYVDPKYSRKGIGRALLANALDKTTPDVHIEVLAGNEAALALYSSFGFKIEATAHGRMPGNEMFEVCVHVLSRISE